MAINSGNAQSSIKNGALLTINNEQTIATATAVRGTNNEQTVSIPETTIVLFEKNGKNVLAFFDDLIVKTGIYGTATTNGNGGVIQGTISGNLIIEIDNNEPILINIDHTASGGATYQSPYSSEKNYNILNDYDNVLVTKSKFKISVRYSFDGKATTSSSYYNGNSITVTSKISINSNSKYLELNL